MESEVSGIILVTALGVAALCCALLLLRLWRAGGAAARLPRDL